MSQIGEDAQRFAAILAALTPIILAGVENEVIYDDKGFGIKFSGFYKDGTVTVRAGNDEPGNPIATVHGRYEDLLELYQGEDLCKNMIRLNAERFKYWNEVKPEFKEIDASWLPLLKEAGLVREVVTYTVR